MELEKDKRGRVHFQEPSPGVTVSEEGSESRSEHDTSVEGQGEHDVAGTA